MIIETLANNDKPNSSHQDKDKAANDLLHIRMILREDFKNYNHSKSGRYYLPEQPRMIENQC